MEHKTIVQINTAYDKTLIQREYCFQVKKKIFCTLRSNLRLEFFILNLIIRLSIEK